MARLPLDALPEFDVPPFRLSGTVYAALLNDPAQLAALGDAVGQTPYKAPPRAPVLAVRPRHMLAGDGAAVELPAGASALEAAASLGIVIGRVACRVSSAQAAEVIAGYTSAIEFGLPLASHYRPAVRFKARDGFCVLGPHVVPAAQVPGADALAVQTWIDGALAQRSSTAGRTRGIAQLIADVTEFMTLQPGDVLLLGAAHGAPLVHAGQSVAVEIAGLRRLTAHVMANVVSPAEAA